MVDNQNTHEATEPSDLATPEQRRELDLAFNAVSGHPAMWYAATLLAMHAEAGLTFWQITNAAKAMQGDNLGFLRDPIRPNDICSFFDTTFTTSGLIILSHVQGRTNRQVKCYRPTERGMLAAAVSGVLIKTQRNHPGIDLLKISGRNKGSRETFGAQPALAALRAIGTRSITDFVPTESLWANAKSAINPAYEGIKRLVGLGVLEKLRRSDPDHCTLTIIRPKIRSQPGKVSSEVRMAYIAAMHLLKNEVIHITGTQLLDQIAAMFPGANTDAIWLRLTHHNMPKFLRAESAVFSKRTERVAVRVAAPYRALVEELLTDLKAVTADPSAQEAARQFAQGLLVNPYYGIVPDAHYSGWHADRHPEKWDPLLPVWPKHRLAATAIARARQSIADLQKQG